MQEPEVYFNIRTRIIIEGLFCNDPVEVNGGTTVAWNILANHWFTNVIE